MNGHRAFQLYLLGSMRNPDLVSEALKILAASRDEVAAARQHWVDLGFENPGVRFADYERVLGKPLRASAVNHVDEYQRGIIAFRFDIWLTMDVVVHGTSDGVASGIRFEHRDQQEWPEKLSPTQLVPWQSVRADLKETGWHRRTTDEWYPVVDIEVTSSSPPERALLQYDFDLLQNVHLLATV
jgi:hypothetical protein